METHEPTPYSNVHSDAPDQSAPTNVPELITATPWQALRLFTDARIALGRAGVSQPTGVHLAFQLAHAQARDAVHLPLDTQGVAVSLQSLGLPTLMLHSRARDRATYLQRPDLGRRLDTPSLEALAHWRNASHQNGNTVNSAGTPLYDLAFVVVDGLSSLAIHQNAAPFLSTMLERLAEDTTQTWSIAPVAVIEQGRVAIGDDVGAQLNARIAVVLIGERPGLSSPDSMGIYITWEPQIGKTDAARNCISNVRPAGLSVATATRTLHRLLTQARLSQLTGVTLKDDVDHHMMTQADLGIRPLPRPGGTITNDLIDRLLDAEGI